MNNNDIDKNVLKNGKKGIKRNLLNAFDEFADEYADETWQIINELIKLRAENAELRARLDKAIELPCLRHSNNDNPAFYVYEVLYINPGNGLVNSEKYVSRCAAEARLNELKLAELKGEK